MTSKKEIKLPGGVKQSDLDSWKKKHGHVHQFTAEDNGKTYWFCLSEPNDDVMSLAYSKAKESSWEAGLVLFQNCWLAGDEAVRTRQRIRSGAVHQTAAYFIGDTPDFKAVEL